MLADNENAVAKREALAWVCGSRGIERSVADGDAGRSCNRPPHSFVLPIPHLDAKGQVGRYVVQIRIRQLPQNFVDAESGPSFIEQNMNETEKKVKSSSLCTSIVLAKHNTCV